MHLMLAVKERNGQTDGNRFTEEYDVSGMAVGIDRSGPIRGCWANLDPGLEARNGFTDRSLEVPNY